MQSISYNKYINNTNIDRCKETKDIKNIYITKNSFENI